MSLEERDIVTSWEKDPNQGFTEFELKTLRKKGLIRDQIQNIL